MKTLRIPFIIIFSFFCQIGFAQVQFETFENLNQLLDKAKKENKLVFIHFLNAHKNSFKSPTPSRITSKSSSIA